MSTSLSTVACIIPPLERNESDAEYLSVAHERKPLRGSADPVAVWVDYSVVDDLGTALEVYGGLAITPNLKRLAAKGTQMRSAFVSIAVCAPSRTAFLTGLRPDTTQVWTIGPYFRATSRGEGMEVVTLPQMFRMHGYNTTGAGKTSARCSVHCTH